MSIRVRIPTVLRRYTDGQEEVRVEGDNVRQLFENLTVDNEPLHSMLFKTSGEFQYNIANVFVNGEDFRFLQKLDTPLKEGDEISIIAAAAGGRGVAKTATSITIVLPPPLQKLFDGQVEMNVEGHNVREALEHLIAQNQELRRYILDDKGEFRYGIALIFVNEEDVRYLQRLDTPLQSGDEIAIVSAAHGGAI